jgi:DNA invertase Pin-like site-specific DNA recombinase
MKAAIYSRVSTASKTKHGTDASYDQNPEVQEQPLRELAAQRGWTVHQVYADRASGAKTHILLTPFSAKGFGNRPDVP